MAGHATLLSHNRVALRPAISLNKCAANEIGNSANSLVIRFVYQVFSLSKSTFLKTVKCNFGSVSFGICVDRLGQTICIRWYTYFVLYNGCTFGTARAIEITGLFYAHCARWSARTRQGHGFFVHHHSNADGQRWNEQHSNCLDVCNNWYGKGNVNFNCSHSALPSINTANHRLFSFSVCWLFCILL